MLEVDADYYWYPSLTKCRRDLENFLAKLEVIDLVNSYGSSTRWACPKWEICDHNHGYDRVHFSESYKRKKA